MKNIILILLVLLCACEKEIKTVTKSTEQLSKTVQEYVNDPNKSVEELEKLHQIEYEVFTLAMDYSNSKYKTVLNEMGRKRWDCFDVQKTEIEDKPHLLFFCKRTPETLLRYVPRTIIGR